MVTKAFVFLWISKPSRIFFLGQVLPGKPIGFETLYTLKILKDESAIGMPHSPGSTGWRVTLPKYEDENRHGEIINRTVHSSFPMGSRIALRCIGKCPKIPWM